ncbi:MAG: hypothetical protein R3B74_03955 [Nitrospirales bacterium]|nr:hypothetical protein [Nitrospirales bacterium]
MFHLCAFLALVGIIFLMLLGIDWEIDWQKVPGPKRERTINRTPLGIDGHEKKWKIATAYRGNVEHQRVGTIAAGNSPLRTRRSLVNTVMALLATFEEAGVLPPEGTAQASQIIHALIQLQSVVVKTSDPDFQRFLAEAIRVQIGNNWEKTYRSLPQTGLTSIVCEALVTYASQSVVWEQQGVARVFRQFNVTEADWVVVETIFLRAREVYAQQGVSIHNVFSDWLNKMS